MKNLLFFFLLLFITLFIFYLNFKDCKENFATSDSNNPVVKKNEESIMDLENEISKINKRTSEILKKASKLLANAEIGDVEYQQLAFIAEQKVKAGGDAPDLDIRKLKIFDEIKNMSKEDLVSILEDTNSSLNAMQKQVLEVYVNILLNEDLYKEAADSLDDIPVDPALA